MANKLFEFYDYARANILLENDPLSKDLYLKGIVMQADIRNQNKRVYPFAEISNAIKKAKMTIQTTGPIMGELSHPEELEINLDRVSHIITDLWMEGNNGHGKLKIVTEHTCGAMAKALLNVGVRLGVSTRGSGNVDDDGVVSDFEMVTVDIVAQPSAPEAYPRTIYESLYNMKGGSALMEMAEGVANGDKSADIHLARALLKSIKGLGFKV